jgi:hypothetical protein
MSLNYIKPEKIVLRNHPEITEKWLQDKIADDPPLLGIHRLSYAGTSMAMIEQDYCARMGLATERTKFAQSFEKPLERLVAGPGFEPGTSRL